MWEWFTKEGVLKENYIQAIERRTIVKNPKQNMPKLKEHPKLRDEMVHILQANRLTIINKDLCNPSSKA
jgi:hypothetical protein